MKRPVYKWIFLFFVISVLLATSAIADTLQTSEQQITTTDAYETTPTLGWGYEPPSTTNKFDLVVYTLLPVLGSNELGPGDIWYQRLVDGAPADDPYRVTWSNTLDDQLNDVSGDFIVYTAYDSVASLTGSIVVYQISTGVVHTLGRADIIQEPKIHGNRVVWREGGSFAAMVMYFELSWLGTGEHAKVIGGPVPPTFDVQIGDRFAVWGERTDSYDVVAYDFDKMTRVQVTDTSTIAERQPATSGAWIVWQQQDGATMTIEAKNMDTGERVTIANGAGNFNPSIDGDLIAWESDVSGNVDVWVHRISTGESFQVTTGEEDEYLNDVFGNMVAYVDMSKGNEDVYVSTLTFVPTEPCTGPTEGLVGCYQFKGDAADGSGNWLHGILHGDPGFTTDRTGNPESALLLDGVNDYVELPSESNFDLTNLTISAIIKVPDYQKQNWLISKGPGFGNFSLRIYEENQTYWPGYAVYNHQTASGNWSSLASSGPVPTDGFFHLAVTLSDTEFRAYVNGNLAQSAASPAAAALNDDPVAIGAGGYYGISDFFVGVIDDLRIYNRPLTSTEICELYNDGLNTKPTADAGPDQAAIQLGTISLDGTQSWDLNGDDINYSWTITSKPVGSTATLSTPSSATPTFNADVQGTYEVQLVVSDSCGLPSDPDTVVVSFANVKPVADAGDNQAVNVGDPVNLDGSGSSDANNDPLTYSWSFNSKPEGSQATLSGANTSTPSFTADKAGVYEVSLVVNDGFVDSDPVIVTVTATTTQSEIDRKLKEAIGIINDDIDPENLKNSNMANALTNKLIAALAMIEEELYQEALDKLETDIVGKTDGCAVSGAPDRNDWLENCEDQNLIYPIIMDAIDLLGDLIP